MKKEAPRPGGAPDSTRPVSKRVNISMLARSRLVVIRGSDVTPTSIQWLWPERFPFGYLAIIAGPGGVGKSTIAVAIAATVSRGGQWPDGAARAQLGKVAWITGEESIEQQLTPRLLAAGANMDNILFIEGVIRDGGYCSESASPVRMSTDAQQIIDLKRDNPDLSLVVIDPLSAFLDSRDSHNEADTRKVFTAWIQAAEEAGVTIIFIAHHNKSMGAQMRDRLSGSVAIRNAVRVVYVAVEDPDIPGQCLLLPEKSNLSDCQIPGLRYKIVGKDWHAGQMSGNVGVVEWIGETDIRANQLVNAGLPTAPPKDAALAFLSSELESGPQPAEQLVARALEMGISQRTLERAKKQLNIVSRKNGTTGKWYWHHPEHELNEAAT